MNNIFNLTTRRDFFLTLPPENFYIRRIEGQGTTYQAVEEAMGAVDGNDLRWLTVVRIIWNESHTVACMARAIPDPNECPDRPCIVFVHKSEIFR